MRVKDKILIFLATMRCALSFAMPNAIEPSYLEAVVQFQSKQFTQALSTLKPLLEKYPNEVKLHELEALAAKGAGQTARAKGIYQKLLTTQPARGPYLYSLGTLAYQAKQVVEAKKYFQQCLQEPFNVEGAHFFLGKIDFEDKKFGPAKDHFLWVTKSRVEDLKPVTLVYLGQIAASGGKSGLAAKYLVQARGLAAEQLKDERRSPESRELASQVVSSVDQSLAGLARGGVFGAISLVSGFDSNVLLSPAGGTNPDGSSNLGSWVETLMPEVGYGTSPLKAWQTTAQYRGAFNYNFNSGTKTGNYAVNQLGVSVGRGISSPWSVGGKLELVSIFQNTGSEYENYSLQANIGPTFRTGVSKEWVAGGELLFSPHNNYRDSQFSYALRRTGLDEGTRLYLRQESRDKYWNPEISLNQSFSHTVGDEFRYMGFGLEASDRLLLTDQWTLGATLGGRYLAYSSRPIKKRFDTQAYLSLSGTYAWTRDVRLGSSVFYFANLSNIDDVYDYNRLVGNVSLSYLF